MPNDTHIAELLTRIRHLETEVRELSTRLEPAEAETDSRETPVARRGLLKQVGGVALGVTAATAAGQVLGATPAAAAQGAPLLLGTGNDSTSMTIYNCDLPGVAGFQTYNFGDDDRSIGFYSYGDGTGVMGRSAVRAGVIGMYDSPNEDIARINRAGVGGVGSSGGVGVLGVSDTDGVVGQGSVGVRGTGTGFGVIGAGSGDQGHGLFGMIGPPSNLPSVSTAITGDTQDRPAIQGLSLRSDAIVGTSGSGRGGVFSGLRGAVRLMPSAVNDHPTDGKTGDLFVDSTGRLWYCSGVAAARIGASSPSSPAARPHARPSPAGDHV